MKAFRNIFTFFSILAIIIVTLLHGNKYYASACLSSKNAGDIDKSKGTVGVLPVCNNSTCTTLELISESIVYALDAANPKFPVRNSIQSPVKKRPDIQARNLGYRRRGGRPKIRNSNLTNVTKQEGRGILTVTKPIKVFDITEAPTAIKTDSNMNAAITHATDDGLISPLASNTKEEFLTLDASIDRVNINATVKIDTLEILAKEGSSKPIIATTLNIVMFDGGNLDVKDDALTEQTKTQRVTTEYYTEPRSKVEGIITEKMNMSIDATTIINDISVLDKQESTSLAHVEGTTYASKTRFFTDFEVDEDQRDDIADVMYEYETYYVDYEAEAPIAVIMDQNIFVDRKTTLPDIVNDLITTEIASVETMTTEKTSSETMTTEQTFRETMTTEQTSFEAFSDEEVTKYFSDETVDNENIGLVSTDVTFTADFDAVTLETFVETNSAYIENVTEMNSTHDTGVLAVTETSLTNKTAENVTPAADLQESKAKSEVTENSYLSHVSYESQSDSKAIQIASSVIFIATAAALTV